MKPSRFNIFQESDSGATLAFNSASAALAEILPDKYPIIQRLMTSPGSASTDEEKQYLAALTEGKYLVPAEMDELGAMAVRNRRQRFGASTFLLTIAPTLACNFRCDYCFEAQSNCRMDRDTEQALLTFAEPRVKRSESLFITWFGGEPTLCIDTIERMQLGFRQMAARFEIPMQPSAIITNGYLLDRTMATRLKELGVCEAQVTLDGPAPVHDTRRKLANGRPTYERILSNLEQSAEIIRIGVRVNVDRLNLETTGQILSDLRQRDLLGKVAVYFAQVNASTTVCADIKDRCLTTEEFSRGQIGLYRKLIDNGFYAIEYPMLSPGGHCGADSDNAFVVGPNGDLFKCWEELSTDHSHTVGSVFQSEATPIQRQTDHAYLSWDPFVKSGCRECEILPICMGGCPRQALRENHPTTGACCSWKYNLREMLSLRYLCDLKRQEAE